MYVYADMREHYGKLDAALWRWGFTTGALTATEFRAAQRELSPLRASGLGYMNPFAREV